MRKEDRKVNKKVACPVCGNYDLSFITNEVRFGKKADVYLCRVCNLAFLDQDSFKFPKDFYEKEYHQTYITHVEPDALNPEVYYEKMKKTAKIWADKFCAMLTGREVILDIGCSTGHFIDLVKNGAKKIYGFELNKKEVDFCRDKLGLDVSAQPLQQRFKEGTFDYITMIYVLEHIAKPKMFLEAAKKLLKPQGKLIILVPNAQDALINFYNIPEFKSFYYCIEHLFYYTPKSLAKLFHSAGLSGKTEAVQEYPFANHLNWAYRRAPSDTLVSRKGMPDIALADNAPADAWNKLWWQFNELYNNFLKDNGYADRIWSVVGRDKDE